MGKALKIKRKEITMDRKIFKKSEEELQEYLRFKHRGTFSKIKKGRGSIYSRKQKHKNKGEYEK